ncbi:MAG: YtxH domain-containing protein [Anaerolineales bacterium]|nr:YtxH domain-containing protein [Anaerolineales bacterium]
MLNDNQEIQYHNNNTFSVFIGLLVGGLAGAVAMLLLAPQSGKDTRVQIQKKGIELRDQTSKMIEDTVSSARSNANRISISGRMKAEELLQQGQALVVEQLDHVSEAAQAGKKTIQGS